MLEPKRLEPIAGADRRPRAHPDQRGFPAIPPHEINAMKPAHLWPFLIAPALAMGADDIQPYPKSWPELAGMSNTCAEIGGTYLDPDAMQWQHENRASGEKFGGTRIAAWPIFRIPAELARAGDGSLSRSFELRLEPGHILAIDYRVNGEIVASPRFEGSDWNCGQDGLRITTLNREGTVLDKIQNHGRTTMSSVLYRVGNYLYVRTDAVTETMVLHVIPQSFRHVAWVRFERLHDNRAMPNASHPAP